MKNHGSLMMILNLAMAETLPCHTSLVTLTIFQGHMLER